jgi:adenine-specific DNA-methyltransferase
MFFPIYFNAATGVCTLERTSPEDVEILPKLGDGRDGRWRWGKDRVVGANLDILHPKYNKSRGKWGIEHRVYLNPNLRTDIGDEEADDDDVFYDRSTKPKSFWWGAEISTDIASREFKELFPELSGDHPKSPFLIEKALRLAARPGDIILDFFAGYSTTAQAAYNLLGTDGAPRRFMMVQLPEKCAPDSEEQKLGYRDIACISRERIRRAVTRNRARLRETGYQGPADFGFRAFSLSRSCFKLWNSNFDENASDDLISRLSDHANHLEVAAGNQEILFELLLKNGFPLTVPIQRLELARKEVFSIAEDALLICLDKQLSQEVIDAMADLEPSRVICLDAGFQGNDQLKAINRRIDRVVPMISNRFGDFLRHDILKQKCSSPYIRIQGGQAKLRHVQADLLPSVPRQKDNASRSPRQIRQHTRKTRRLGGSFLRAIES